MINLNSVFFFFINLYRYRINDRNTLDGIHKHSESRGESNDNFGSVSVPSVEANHHHSTWGESNGTRIKKSEALNTTVDYYQGRIANLLQKLEDKVKNDMTMKEIVLTKDD